MSEQVATTADHGLADQIAEVRARRAALEAKRNKREDDRKLAEKLVAERLALANDEAIEKAECEYGPLGKKIAAVLTESGVVIVKRAPSPLYRRFQDSGKQSTMECEKLLRPCLVHPDPATFDQWADEEPAIILRTANAICTLAGVKAEDVSGK